MILELKLLLDLTVKICLNKSLFKHNRILGLILDFFLYIPKQLLIWCRHYFLCADYPIFMQQIKIEKSLIHSVLKIVIENWFFFFARICFIIQTGCRWIERYMCITIVGCSIDVSYLDRNQCVLSHWRIIEFKIQFQCGNPSLVSLWNC